MLAARAALLLAALASCRTEPATQLIVVIDTDIPAATMDGVATRVFDRDQRLVSEERFTLGDGAPAVRLPADFAIGPKGGDARRTVRVEVDALAGDEVLFGTHAVTSFRAERSLRLDMFLAARCIDEAGTCGPDERCTAEGCVPATIDPEDLPLFDGNGDADAGPDPDGATPGPDGAAADGGASDGTWTGLLTGVDAMVAAAAFGPDGDLYLVLTYSAGLTFEDGWEAPPAAELGVIVVRFDTEGNVVWRAPYAGGGGLFVTDAAVVSDGAELMVIGSYAIAADLGGAPLEPQGHITAFASRFSTANGENLGNEVFTSPVKSVFVDIAVNVDGSFAVVGHFAESVESEAFVPTRGFGGQNDLLFLFEPDGAVRCSATLGTDPVSESRATGVAFGPTGPVVTGVLEGTTDIGGQRVTSVETDSWVVRFDDRCVVADRPADILTGAGDQLSASVAVSGSDVTVAGSTTAGVSVGGFDFPAAGAGNEAMVVRLTPGAPTASILGGTFDDNASHVLPLESGNVLVAMLLGEGAADLAGIDVEVPVGGEGAIVELDPECLGLSVRQVQGTLSVVYGMVRSAATGNVAVWGNSSDLTELPDGETMDLGTGAAFVSVFSP